MSVVMILAASIALATMAAPVAALVYVGYRAAQTEDLRGE